jgi:hypothetical protein
MENVAKDTQAMEIVNWERYFQDRKNGRQLLSRPKLVSISVRSSVFVVQVTNQVVSAYLRWKM